MKRIVLCFDGTWDKPADSRNAPDKQIESNVCRLFESILPKGQDGVVQAPWYNAGVGTEWYDKVVGGVFGAGLDQHILDGYKQLVTTYEDGDEVYVLGFSRGAYTARSMVGLIRNCGLVKPSFGQWQIGAAYGIYRTRTEGPDSTIARGFRAAFSREITIKFVGVWDTVGALGIPLHFADRLNRAYYQFHDTTLSTIVQRGYQAVSIDEHREDYAICLWDPPTAPTQTLEQRWFCGAHADVGGGYGDRRLSDLTLRWMQDRAVAAGLAMNLVAPDADGYKGAIADSYGDFLNGIYAQTHAPCYRKMLSTVYGNEEIDPTVDRRRRDAGLKYAPTNPGLPVLV